MGKINLTTATKNLKKNFLLLPSTAAALCLFLLPSPISLLMIVVVFVAVTMVALLDLAKPPAVSNSLIRFATVLIAMLIAFMGYYAFKNTWMPFGKVAPLANELHLTTPRSVRIVGLVGCTVGFYAMYTLSCWIVKLGIQQFKERLPEQKKSEIVANLKRNWYFPISAMAFFCLQLPQILGYLAALPIAFAASLVISSQISSIVVYIQKAHFGFKIVSLLTALGICWSGQMSFDATWSVFEPVQALESMFPISIDIPAVFAALGAAVSLYFVYVCVLTFWKEMMRIISENGLFSGIVITEWIVYSILLIVSLALVVISFVQTEAFYGTQYLYDIIYTSDSPNLVKGNVYLALAHGENDLRQPLFAVFAAPFVGIPYLFGKLFGASASVQAILVNMVQVVVLLTANFMLTRMMKLNPAKRVCFMLLASCTYTHLLFTLMMEQYIVAYFWLVFCMYLITEKQRPDRIALWGAGGTLLTSLILLPFMSDKNPIRNIKEWFFDMVKFGLEFVAVMFVFCRFDVIFNLVPRISFLGKFTGKTVTFADKFYQYITFVSNCFVAPDAGVSTATVQHSSAVPDISWQLNTVTSINFIGITILLLAIVSAVLNRDKKSSLLSAGWVAFSVVMLLGLGWGTQENGLILYALYFGWAFLVLLFQLVEKTEDKLNIKFLVPVFSIGCTVVLAVVNIPAILEIVNFAITYFPV